MADKKDIEITDLLSAEQVAKQCNRQVSQIYNALAFGKLTEAAMPDWVNKKGIMQDDLLKKFIANCKRLDEKKKNKPATTDPVIAAQKRLERKQEKAKRMAEQVKKQEERLERMRIETTKGL